MEIFVDEMTWWMACASKLSSGGEEVGRGQRCSELGHDVRLWKLASLNASLASKDDVRPFGLSWGPK